MTDDPGAAARALTDLLDYWTPLLTRAAVEAGVFEAIGRERVGLGPIAAQTGLHGPTLARLLRALAGRGLVDETDPEEAGDGGDGGEGSDPTYALTEMGRRLLAHHPESMAGMATFKPWDIHAFAELEHTLHTGEPGFDHHYGLGHFEWLAEHPDMSARFDRSMARRTAALHRSSTPLLERLPAAGTIVDIGGGNGALLALILRDHPDRRGILFDQPHVVAQAPEVLAAAGVADRVRVDGGDFFEAIPPDGDVYVMVNVLHDWDDDDALRLLGRVHEAMPGGARLLIGDAVLNGPNEWDPFKIVDLVILVLLGARERAEPEWRALLGQAGFDVVSVARAAGLGCIEATPR